MTGRGMPPPQPSFKSRVSSRELRLLHSSCPNSVGAHFVFETSFRLGLGVIKRETEFRRPPVPKQEFGNQRKRGIRKAGRQEQTSPLPAFLIFPSCPSAPAGC